jgi:glycosyltransferase involved in cell wall biosynthesis
LGNGVRQAVGVQTSDSTPVVRARGRTIALLIPTLNEIEGLKAIVPHIDRSLVDDVVVIDGGSTDGTVEYAYEQGFAVASQTRRGLAAAVFDIAQGLPHDFLVEFSPDGNCKAEQLGELVAKLDEGYDHVVVSRYLGDAVSEDDHLVSAFGNWMFSRLMRPLAAFAVTDALNIYRVWRRDIALDPDFAFYLRGPVLEPLVTGYCGLKGLRSAEIPGDEPPRIGGATKRSIIYNGAMVLLMIVRLYLRKFLRLRV